MVLENEPRSMITYKKTEEEILTEFQYYKENTPPKILQEFITDFLKTMDNNPSDKYAFCTRADTGGNMTISFITRKQFEDFFL